MELELKYIDINGFGVLIDESADILPKDYMIHSGHQNKIKKAKFDGIENKWIDWWKIIFAEKELSLNVPILPDWREWEVEQKLIKHLESNHIEASVNRVKVIMDFINNNNNSKYTEEEAIGFYLWARKKYGSVKPIEEGCVVTKTDYKGLFQLYVQSLQKLPKYIVMESDSYFTDEAERNEGLKRDGKNILKELRPKLIRNSNGKLQGIIKEIIW